ncbi:MAG TPA: hypothetical protein VFX19_04925, partial [Dehalococcoidia bacterium]|nr:hypothetical protein [Dehalococcoidia bacterium]
MAARFIAPLSQAVQSSLKLMMSEQRRRSMRLDGFDYSSPGGYFVTFCTLHRVEYFGTVANGKMALNDAGAIVTQEWTSLGSKFPNIELDEFVVMPNH